MKDKVETWARKTCEKLDLTRTILEKEPPYIELPDDKPIVFVGDTHGDYKTVRSILTKFMLSHRMVFLGDYVDRASEFGGSFRTLELILDAKIALPDDVILLRGNHEFKEMYKDDFAREVHDIFYDRGIAHAEKILDIVGLTFGQMPYVAATGNGVIALHGGLPHIGSVNELRTLPKGLVQSADNPVACQIVWNDHLSNRENRVRKNIPPFTPNYQRKFTTAEAIQYGSDYFCTTMDLLGKKVLVRGHDHQAKGYAFRNRILTIFSTQRYADCGELKGAYVAVMDDPMKKIRTAKDLRLFFFTN